jgi:alpha-tubulin suppressor-like RCC1 family protein
MLVTQDSSNPRVLTWGRGQYGQLGHNSQPADEVLAPTAVPCLEGRPVARLACGQFHTSAVVAGPKGSGGVLTWGRGTLGVLGHGDEEDRLEPQTVELLTGIDLC